MKDKGGISETEKNYAELWLGNTTSNHNPIFLGLRKVSKMNRSLIVTLPLVWVNNFLKESRTVNMKMNNKGELILEGIQGVD